MRRAIAILSLVPVAAVAHQLYLMPSSFQVSSGERITVGFHNGDSFPESEAPPSLARLRDAAVHAGKLQYNVTNIRIDGERAVGDARIPARGTVVIAARTTPNFIELEPAAFEKYLKDEGMAQVIAWRKERGESAKPGRELYSKYVKSLVHATGAGDDTYAKPVGFAIELIPEKDPYALKVGDQLPVRLLWKGKPASGVMIEASRIGATGPAESKAIGRTDAEGRVQLFVEAAGRWRLHAIAIERHLDEAKADWESFWASLTFEIR